MDKKFEKLIDLIINENEEQARELFHDIVVEKSREIYESIMDEEMMDSGMGGQVGDLLDEIGAEESGGLSEEGMEDDMGDIPGDEMGDEFGGDDVVDIDADDVGADVEGEQVEDAVVRIEDKLDQLMAEFEEIMGGGEGDEAGEEGDSDFGGEEDMAADAEGEADMADAGDDMGSEEVAEGEEEVMEAITLKKIPGLYDSKIGGDDGAQTKSAVGSSANSGQSGMASKPVKFSGAAESVPTGPKGPSNYAAKGETQVKDASNWKNAPNSNAGKTAFKDKASRDFGKKDSSSGKEAGAGGSVSQNDKSVIESKKSVKKQIK